eukprot:4131692-Amphidinium_carterae.1
MTRKLSDEWGAVLLTPGSAGCHKIPCRNLTGDRFLFGRTAASRTMAKVSREIALAFPVRSYHARPQVTES